VIDLYTSKINSDLISSKNKSDYFTFCSSSTIWCSNSTIQFFWTYCGNESHKE